MAEKELVRELIETLHREVRFGKHDVQPATNLYVTVEDRLRVLIFNSTAAAEVDVLWRLQLPNGEVIPFVRQLFPTSNRASNSFEQDLAEGFLLDCSVSTPTAALRAGACYVLVQIIRGTGVNAIVVRSLIANYLTTGLSIGWPEGPSQGSVQGNGLARSFNLGSFTAGTDFTVTVPTGARWLVQNLEATLVTSAAVATRQVVIEVLDNNGLLCWAAPASSTQTASLTDTYSFTGGVNPGGTAPNFITPLPDVVQLAQGFKIVTVTTALQAGDQWTAAVINVIEWIEQ